MKKIAYKIGDLLCVKSDEYDSCSPHLIINQQYQKNDDSFKVTALNSYGKLISFVVVECNVDERVDVYTQSLNKP